MRLRKHEIPDHDINLQACVASSHLTGLNMGENSVAMYRGSNLQSCCHIAMQS